MMPLFRTRTPCPLRPERSPGLHGAPLNGIALLLAVVFAASVVSCGIGTFSRSLFGETLDIRLLVDSTANLDIPLSMDLVYVCDDELLLKLLEMPASQWFAKKQDLKNNYPDESGFRVHEWEWPPGADTTLHIPLSSGTEGGIIYVNYYDEGQHRVRIDLFRNINIHLGIDDFAVKLE